jgi:type II secretory pathway pseudopilin PulG
VKLSQINRLVSTAPVTLEHRQRARLQALQETASRCELRIRWLREQLEQALHTPDAGGVASGDNNPTAPNTALTLASELDALERLQPRVDAWLVEYVASLAAAHEQVDYGDGQPV